ncbi:MAG: hypothetical protein RL211_2107 [Pseudomonadota bacterium]
MHRQKLRANVNAGKSLYAARLFTRQWNNEFHNHLRNVFEGFRLTRLTYLVLVALTIPVALLSACNPYGGAKPILHTTISADGKMVATLVHAGTDQQLLRVRNLDTDTSWRTIQAPPFTRTIRFGLQGHELLLTHQQPEPSAVNYLSRLDLARSDQGLQKIYESENGLAFPVEVQLGQVMVRTHKPADFKTGKVSLSDSYWVLIGPGKQIQKVGPESILPYDAPNIVNTGFFWTEEQVGKQKEAHPLVLSFPFPGGVAPAISRERLDKNTWTVDCDRSMQRCLRTFISKDHVQKSV